MAWVDVPAKLIAYDNEEYADNTNGTTASYKLLRSYSVDAVGQVPVDRRADFEADLDYRLKACINLRNSRGKSAAWLRAAMS